MTDCNGNFVIPIALEQCKHPTLDAHLVCAPHTFFVCVKSHVRTFAIAYVKGQVHETPRRLIYSRFIDWLVPFSEHVAISFKAIAVIAVDCSCGGRGIYSFGRRIGADSIATIPERLK
jgi:hypothetical protein